MNKLLFGFGAVILVGVIGYGMYQNKEMMPSEGDKAAMMQKEADAMAMKEKEAQMSKENMTPEQMEAMKKEEAMKAGETMMKKDGETMQKDAQMAKSAGMYAPYSADKLVLAKENKVVIFFHAGWCPTCRALDAEITSKGVKEGYVILKADYDSSRELKAKYGVTSQHTLVQVNTAGASLGKWTGGDLAGIYAKAK